MGHRDVCGQKGRRGGCRCTVRGAAASIYDRTSGFDSTSDQHGRRARGQRRAPQRDSGRRAAALPSSRGMRLRAPLPIRRRQMPRELSAVRAKTARTLGGLLALGPAYRSGLVSAAVLEVADLKKHFPIKRGIIRRTIGQVYAVDGVSFEVHEGQTLGLVGESGCGKSTVARTVLRLLEPTGGTIKLNGHDITHLSKAELRPYRRGMQIIFQDPYSSLNPRMTAGDIVGEPLEVHDVGRRKQRAEQVATLFEQVGLSATQMKSFPHEFSGGQRQRISIARALALNPKLIVADEPVSALDVSIQAQVINLMMDLQREKKLSYLFIAHGLAVVEHISHRVAVMYLGKIVEHAEKATLFLNPLHPYTEALLAAVPIPTPKLRRAKRPLGGDVPSPVNPPPGCAFHTRCGYAQERCRREIPQLREVAPGHWVSCHLR